MPARRLAVSLLVLVVGAGCVPSQQEVGQAPAAAAPAAGRLRAIRIATGDVFAEDVAAQNLVPRLLDALHWTTRHDLIEREIWFAPGDHVDAEQAAELERNLRRLGLFAEVSVQLVPTGTPDEVDMLVATRDQLSLFFGGGGSYVGGVAGFNVVAGEGNLFGRGDRIDAGFRRNSDKEYRGSVSYSALHLFDSLVTGTVRLQRTDDGDSVGIELARPFKHLTEPRAWNGSALYEESATDYHLDGDVVATVPQRRSALSGNLLWGEGPARARTIRGLTLALDRRSYEPAVGPLAAQIRVPGDTTSLLVGGTMRWDRVSDYRKVTGFDTLDYVQDLTLGTRVWVLAGARLRDEDGRDAELQPETGVQAGWLGEPVAGVFTGFAASGGARWYSGTTVGWNASGRGQVFWDVGGNNVLCTGAVFDAVEEHQDLPVELTLGEDNGLRGYPARELSGSRRLRLNLEDRFDTGLELWTLQFGLVAFADAGWVGRGSDLGRPLRAVGVGMRIGSKPLLGSNVLRIDIARPLDDIVGGTGDWSVSVAIGQVFGL